MYENECNIFRIRHPNSLPLYISDIICVWYEQLRTTAIIAVKMEIDY